MSSGILYLTEQPFQMFKPTELELGVDRHPKGFWVWNGNVFPYSGMGTLWPAKGDILRNVSMGTVTMQVDKQHKGAKKWTPESAFGWRASQVVTS